MIKFFSFCAVFFMLGSVYAQKNITHQNLYWLRYYNQLTINPKFTWHNEFENRRFFTNNRQHHFILHSRLHYKILPTIDVAAGVCYSRQSPQLESATINLVVPEFRLEQEVNLTNPLTNHFSISHRLRADERFIHKNNGAELEPGHDFNFRFRYRILATINLNKDKKQLPTNLKIGNEMMINAGKSIVFNHFDQNRILLSFEKGIHENFAAELGYIHWYQQRPSGKDFFSRNIFRLTLSHKIQLKKKS